MVAYPEKGRACSGDRGSLDQGAVGTVEEIFADCVDLRNLYETICWDATTNNKLNTRIASGGRRAGPIGGIGDCIGHNVDASEVHTRESQLRYSR